MFCGIPSGGRGTFGLSSVGRQPCNSPWPPAFSIRCSTSRTLPRRGKYYYQFKRTASSSGSVTFRWQTVFTQGPHGGNIGFHTIPVNSSGHEIAPVGKPVSHGCVRCPKKKALFLYRWIDKRTPIIVRP